MFDEQAYLEEIKAENAECEREIAIYARKIAEIKRKVEINQATMDGVKARLAMRDPEGPGGLFESRSAAATLSEPRQQDTFKERYPEVPTSGHGAINKAILIMMDRIGDPGVTIQELAAGLSLHAVEIKAPNYLEAARNQSKWLIKTGRLTRHNGRLYLSALGKKELAQMSAPRAEVAMTL